VKNILTVYGALIVALALVTSCGGGTKKESKVLAEQDSVNGLVLDSVDGAVKEYSSAVDKNMELILSSNSSLNLSEDILDYVPENIKNDKELSEYVSDSYETFCQMNEGMNGFLDNAAEFKNEEIELKKNG